MILKSVILSHLCFWSPLCGCSATETKHRSMWKINPSWWSESACCLPAAPVLLEGPLFENIPAYLPLQQMLEQLGAYLWFCCAADSLPWWRGHCCVLSLFCNSFQNIFLHSWVVPVCLACYHRLVWLWHFMHEQIFFWNYGALWAFSEIRDHIFVVPATLVGKNIRSCIFL